MAREESGLGEGTGRIVQVFLEGLGPDAIALFAEVDPVLGEQLEPDLPLTVHEAAGQIEKLGACPAGDALDFPVRPLDDLGPHPLGIGRKNGVQHDPHAGIVLPEPVGDEAVYLEEGTVQASAAVLNETMATPGHRIPKAMLSDAYGVAIIPNVIKGSFVVGARHGRGLLFIREANGVWHAPVFITLRRVKLDFDM